MSDPWWGILKTTELCRPALVPGTAAQLAVIKSFNEEIDGSLT